MRKQPGAEDIIRCGEHCEKLLKREPWKRFKSVDLFAIQMGRAEDSVFLCFTGHDGDARGFAAYEGLDAFNNYLMIRLSTQLNLTTNFALSRQTYLSCFLEDDDLNVDIPEEMKYKSEDGFKAFFSSFKDGFMPSMADKDELRRISEYAEVMILALDYFYENRMLVNFDNNKMLHCKYNLASQSWKYTVADYPLNGFSFGKLYIKDEAIKTLLKNSQKTDDILEVDLRFADVAVPVEGFDRLVNPLMCVFTDADSGEIVKYDCSKPGEDPYLMTSDMAIDLIRTDGAPKEIRVSNMVMMQALEEICKQSGIRLRRVKNLPAVDYAVPNLFKDIIKNSK